MDLRKHGFLMCHDLYDFFEGERCFILLGTVLVVLFETFKEEVFCSSVRNLAFSRRRTTRKKAMMLRRIVRRPSIMIILPSEHQVAKLDKWDYHLQPAYTPMSFIFATRLQETVHSNA